jgi:hypothetical protein
MATPTGDGRKATMSEIRILEGARPDGPWGTGPGTYEAGLLRLPGGEARGVEDLVDLVRADGSGPQRRTGIVGGLRSALDAAGPLPRPLDFATSILGLGLGALAGTLHASATLHARFADGARAVIATDPATAAAILHDWAVVREALLRRDARRQPPRQVLLPPPAAAPLTLPAPAPVPDAAPAPASLFAYEMRKGRLRRLASGKAPERS